MRKYTYFDLWIENEDEISLETYRAVKVALTKIFDDWDENEVQRDDVFIEDIVTYEALIWYTHSADMLELSYKFPDCKFVLEGHGVDDYSNIWREYYWNGKSSYARGFVTFEKKPFWE